MAVLYRKWRPRTWDQVVGQQAVVDTLRHAVQTGRLAHAYLFSGPRGTGKTTLARLLAKGVNCLHPDPARRPCDACDPCRMIQEGRFIDLIEMDAASHTGVDDVRQIRETVAFAPTQGRYKVYIIDEVHMLSTAAFNALLKTLEEPPAHVIFVLATTEVHKVPVTVRSRCQSFPFRRIPVPDITAYLHRIVQAEGIQAEEQALVAIARYAEGSLRDAISLLDQLAGTGQPVTLSRVQQLLGTVSHQVILDILDAMMQKDVRLALMRLHQTLDSGADARELSRQLTEHIRYLMMVQTGADAVLDLPSEVVIRLKHLARQLSPRTLVQWLQTFQQASSLQGLSWHPSLPLELAVVEVILFLRETEGASPASTQQNAGSPSASSSPSEVQAASSGPVSNAEGQKERSDERTEPPSDPVPQAGSRGHTVSHEEPTSSSPPPAPSSALHWDLERVLEAWPNFIAHVEREAVYLASLLKRARLVQVKDGVFVLEAERFAAEQLQRPKHKQRLQRLLSDFYKAPVTLRVQRMRPPHPAIQEALRLGGRLKEIRPLLPEENDEPAGEDSPSLSDAR